MVIVAGFLRLLRHEPTLLLLEQEAHVWWAIEYVVGYVLRPHQEGPAQIFLGFHRFNNWTGKLILQALWPDVFAAFLLL